MRADHVPPADVDPAQWPGREHGLSAREAEVIALITQGLDNKEIGERMLVSANTVKSYIRSAYRKIGVDSRTRAVLWGIDNGFRADSSRGSPPDDSRGAGIEPTQRGLPAGKSGRTVLHLAPPAQDFRGPGTGLLEALDRWRDSAWTASAECHVPEHRAIDANRATIELAKDALMRRYGVDAFQAFTLLVRWARLTHAPVHGLAKTLVRDIDEEDRHPERRRRSLIRWLEGISRLTANTGPAAPASSAPAPRGLSG